MSSHSMPTKRVLSPNTTSDPLRQRTPSEPDCAAIMESLATPIAFKDPVGHFSFCNTAFTTFLGYTREEILGKRSCAFVSNKDAKTYEAMDNQLLHKGGVLECEARFKTRSGLRDVCIRKSLLRDAQGSPNQIVCEFFDITERKRAEADLLHSNERFQLAMHGTNDGLWDWERSINRVYYSPRWKEIIGYKDHEIPNRIEEWKNRIHPEDYDRVMQANDRFYTSMASHFTVEYRFLHRDGSYRWILGRGTCLRDSLGHPYRIAGAHTDITRQKLAEKQLAASEQRFRTILDQARRVAVQGYDEKRRVFYWNRASELLYGYTSEEALGQKLEDLIIPEHMRAEVVRGITAWLEEGPPIPASELTLRHKDGSEVPVFSSHVMQTNHEGRQELFCIDVDISEVREANLALVQAKEEAEQASLAKSRFLANMSHEIRTPLSGISSMLDILRDTPLTTDQHSYMDMTCSACERLTSLLGDILDLSKVEAGTLELREDAVNLPSLLDATWQMFLPAAERLGLTLTCRVGDTVPDTLRGDGHRLQQILNNLVGNALKFTDQGGTIFLGCDVLPRAPKDQTCILLSVRDTGAGIPEHRLATLFDAFVQGDDRYSRNHQGAGLGLSIVKTLTRLMHGTVTVESTEGEGTTFYISIPFKNSPPVVTPPVAITPCPQVSLSRLRVLLVEDDRVNRVAASTLLGRDAASVMTAENGREALDLLTSNTFDLILMDIQMPVMDGLEAVARIRTSPEYAAHRNTPVIALTAYAMEEDREQFLQAGMTAHLVKPFSVEKLLKVLERIASVAGE